ncbi:MAG: HAMP domain-containing histidine kinase [Lachnospiraceae bacterium]|nr:HAMP domain-containing histidine kinase [Lachnospiraceae bacterium]
MERERRTERAAWGIHALTLALLLGVIYLGFRYSDSTYYGDAVAGNSYEDSEAFGNQVVKSVRNAVRYSILETRFETDGSLDLEKEVQTVTQEDGTEISYTLQDALDYGRDLGVYFDEKNHLVVGEKNENDGKQEEGGRGESGTQTDGGGSQDEAESALVPLSLLYQLSEYYQLQRELGFDGSGVNFFYRFIYVDTDGKTVVSTNADSALSDESVEDYGRYFTATSETGAFESNLSETVTSSVFSNLAYNQLLAGGTYEIMVAVDTTFSQSDAYLEGENDYVQFARLIRMLLTLGAVLLLALAVSFAGLVVLGRRELRGIDLWYAEIVLLGEAVMLFVLYFGVMQIRYGYTDGYWLDIVSGEVLLTLAYFPAVFLLLSLIRRLRQHQFASRSLCCQAVRGLRENLRSRGGRWRSRSRVAALLSFQMMDLLVTAAAVLELYRRVWLPGSVLLAAALLLNVWNIRRICERESQYKRIFERVESLSRGNVGRKLDTEGMTGELAQIAGAVNALDDSLENAVRERTASERMKTDLIANVSHDLRTPLTSIISYVDLLKRENLPDPRVQEYLRILEEKAARLRTLTEALMEANRVSSGNLDIQWVRIDLVQMVNQVLGEFQERLEEAGLTPVVHLVPPPAAIRADGKLLWRVFDNLFTNVCKYAKPGTHVYIDLQETAHSLIYTMKNVSASSLELPAEDLMERFTRGDASRSSEGSGLGLSIARSITEQLHGRFELFTDGASFRVRLVFFRAEEERQKE